MASLKKENHFTPFVVTNDGNWSFSAVLLKHCSTRGTVTDSEPSFRASSQIVRIDNDSNWLVFFPPDCCAHLRTSDKDPTLFLLVSFSSTKREDPWTLLACDALRGKHFRFPPKQQTTTLQQQVTATHTRTQHAADGQRNTVFRVVTGELALHIYLFHGALLYLFHVKSVVTRCRISR